MKWIRIMFQATERRPYASAALAGMMLLILLYGPILIQPNRWMFSQNGDGLKNYYTYAYHIRHDASYTNHMGMNYPYGENHLYIDGHPLPANVLKALSSVFPSLSDHAIALLHLALLLSIPLAVVCLTAVLRYCGARTWLAIVFALGIVVLSPQIFRIDGHFALSYSCALPMTWWLYLRCRLRPSFSTTAMLFFNGVFWLFVHAYLGMIVLSWMLLTALFDLFTTTAQTIGRRSNFMIVGALVLPIALFYAYAKCTDTHIGRTDNPSGFFQYNAELDDVFVPPLGPVRELLEKIPGLHIRLNWEACGYVGCFNALVLVTLLVLLMRSIVRKKKNAPKRYALWLPALFSAIVLMVFAMGIPFKQFPSLLDSFSILKQFRATGRFVWPLYFVSGVLVAWTFELVWRRTQGHPIKRILAWSALGLYVVLQTFEGYGYHASKRVAMMNTPNHFDANHLDHDMKTALALINPQDYQAIVSLPFFYQGSETYARALQDEAVRQTLLFSYHSGLPTVCANLTRTGVEESKRIVQWVTAPYFDKPIRNDLPNGKPMLVLKTHLALTDNESALLQRSEPIFHSASFDLYRLELDDAFANFTDQELAKFEGRRSQLYLHGDYLSTSPEDDCYVQNFDHLIHPLSHAGQGAYSGLKRGENTIAEWQPATWPSTTDYRFSMWMHNGEKDALNLWFPVYIEELDNMGHVIEATRIFPDQAETIDGNWSLVEGNFELSPATNKVRIKTIGNALSKAALLVDDLLIRPAHVDIYSDKVADRLYFNNLWLRTK